MLGRLGRRLAVAAVFAAGLGATASFAQPVPTVQTAAPRRAKRGLFGGYAFNGAPMFYGSKGASLGMAQQQRAAKKTRNVQRHKRHVRGAR